MFLALLSARFHLAGVVIAHLDNHTLFVGGMDHGGGGEAEGQ